MSTIHQLDEATINKIAAGEVIERPMSVVKELVENSLDAGATRIEVDILNGGKTQIIIKDNGQGMSPEDILLAIQRHATSKISSASDLFSIKSLGFRGEALPSIASISKMTIISKARESSKEEPGRLVALEGGRVVKTEAAPSQVGTVITVQDLFFNVPARLKFLKKDVTELGQIVSVMSAFILGHPTVAFIFRSNNKVFLQSPGAAAFSQEAIINAAAVIFGAALAKTMRAFEFASSFVQVKGLLASPDQTKADRTGQYYFLNKRAIFNIALSKAVGEGLRDRIPRGRFPICILFLKVKPEEVDVNVHPTKREVKFLKQQEIFSGVLSAVKNTFQKIEEKHLSAVEIISKDPFVRMQSQHVKVTDHSAGGQESFLSATELREMLYKQTSAINQSFASMRTHLVPIGQANKTYIVALEGENLVLIDQHVAQERIFYEELKKQQAKKEDNIQSLLIPETIELTPAQENMLTREKEFLLAVGFRWEDFGQRTVLLRGVPQLMSHNSPQQLFLDIIDELVSAGASFKKEEREEELLKMIACKASIKAGVNLSLQEMNQLLADLEKTTNPYTCPHGRPIIVAISKEELDKKFGRM